MQPFFVWFHLNVEYKTTTLVFYKSRFQQSKHSKELKFEIRALRAFLHSKVRIREINSPLGPKNLIELERFELRGFIYESFLRKFDGDFEFVRIRERFELRGFELERVNCIY